MTAVASPPSFEQINHTSWGANGGQSLNPMSADEVSRMFQSRKSAQRSNSSSSISSASSTTTLTQPPQTNGVPPQSNGEAGIYGTAAARKKPPRSGPWPANKAEPVSSVTAARPQSILATNGASAATSMQSLQPSSVVLSQQVQPHSQQQSAARPAPAPVTEQNPVLYLLSMNGRQTNAKTIPTPSNGFFDSKVLSRQHAEIWADRNGKIWIRDVRSSNGTFVNGARLSAENRDSEPHELQTSDHLELGIDIVSEDQKTVVHHKVAAKVEHAGFLGTPSNVLDMSFGDLDPTSGSMMLPLPNAMLMRGRTNSQGSLSSMRSMGPPGSVAPSSLMAGNHRAMSFWLTPVTTEHIIKRLDQQIKLAKLHQQDLQRSEAFLDSLVSKEDIKGPQKVDKVEKIEKVDKVLEVKPVQINGVVPFKIDPKPRFTDPPAPPPQQPLPEKPDVIRAPFDPTSPSLKRSSTERPRSVPNVSHSAPPKQETTSQIISLLEALASAKTQIDTQNDRLRDLEDMLQKEREARESAEERAQRLELESIGVDVSGMKGVNSVAKQGTSGSIVEEAFNPPTELVIPAAESSPPPSSTESIEDATAKLQAKLDLMMMEMREMKENMETYRVRAETAEAERDSGRITLAQMVEKIRADEQIRRSSSTERARSPSKKNVDVNGKPAERGNEEDTNALSNSTVKGVSGNGTINTSSIDGSLAMALSRPPGSTDPLLYHTGPYASMIGIVILGMGLMAYMNGWQQKVER